MKTSQDITCKLGVAITCLLLGAVAPNLHAQGVQYTKPKDNVVQAQPYRTTPHYYTAHSNVPPNASAMQLTCPPGTQRYQGHCVGVPHRPGHAHPHTYAEHSNLPPGITPTHAAKPHRFPPKMIDRSKVKPQPGVPIEHQGHASNTHGIIFVGGKQALNPQPIPPGHSLRHIPHPGAPIEKKIGH